MKVEIRFFCSNCNVPSSLMVVDLQDVRTASPDGWANVALRLDVPRAPSQEEKALGDMMDFTMKKTGISLHVLPGLVQRAPPRFETEMVLCSKCQEGPVFQAAMKELEEGLT